MPNCEICGKSGILVKAIISGTELEVCEPCGKFGKIQKKPIPPSPQQIGRVNAVYNAKPAQRLEESPLSIAMDYAAKIKSAREKAKLSHEDLSKRIAEKTSMLHHIENGHHEPTIDVARKLERFFGIKLVDETDENKQEGAIHSAKPSQGMTLGDFMKVRKR